MSKRRVVCYSEDMDTTQRFLSKVVIDENECWIWQPYSSGPYGRFSVRGRLYQAHRWSYERFVGPIPTGLELDHTCRVTKCVNPKHLEPVTRAENIRRAAQHRTECSNGHPYTEENTLITKAGRKSCRACRFNRVRKFRSK